MRLTAFVTVLSAVSILPVFLLSGLTVLMRVDVGADASTIGLAATAFFLTSSGAATFGGRLVDARGARQAAVRGLLLTGTALLCIALLARSVLQIVLLLGICGVANGVTQPALNTSLAYGTAPNRRGTAFGIKQSSIPGATLVVGAAVPGLSAGIGWRMGFISGAGLSLLAAVLVRYLPDDGHDAAADDGPTTRSVEIGTALRWLAVAGMLGAAGSLSVSAFFIEWGVIVGMSPARAGVLLSLGSLGAIGSRVLAGVFVDRGRGSLTPVMGGLLLIGGVGTLMPVLPFPAAQLAGVLLALSVGAGWTGLYFVIALQYSTASRGRAMGLAQAAAAGGGVFGPLLVGLLATSAGFVSAWLLVAAFFLISFLALARSRSHWVSGR